jgi:hypothetical protein
VRRHPCGWPASRTGCFANAYREDFAQAGLGGGHHSFTFELPEGLAAIHEAIEVRRSLDGVPIETATVEMQRKLRRRT